MSIASLVVIGLGVLLVIFGGVVLIWFPSRQGGTVKAVNVEVSAPGAGLVLMVIGVAAATFGATQMGGQSASPAARAEVAAAAVTPTPARSNPAAAASPASGAPRPSAVSSASTNAATNAAPAAAAGAGVANSPALAFVPLPNPAASPVPVKAFGPATRVIPQNESKLVPNSNAGVNERDFIAEAQFVNPYDRGQGAWDYGFLFRDNGAFADYRVWVESEGKWFFRLYRGEGQYDDISNGQLPEGALKLAANDSNTLRLIATNNLALFFVNDTFVAALDVSSRLDPGDVRLAVGFTNGHQINGFSTNVNNFTVRAYPEIRAFPEGQIATNPQTLGVFIDSTTVRDFVAETTFANPYDRAANPWDYGFIFRATGASNPHYRLWVDSNSTWTLSLFGTQSPAQTGKVQNLKLGPSDSNTLRLVAIGDHAYFFVNGTFAGTLDVSGRQDSGNVNLATSFQGKDSQTGASTRFSNFMVWSPDQ